MCFVHDHNFQFSILNFPLLQLVLNNREEDFNVTQQGTIKKLLPNGLAEVEVTRRSACGHDCAKCGGCGGLETQTLYVTARNHAHASVGDRVLLEGETRQVLGFAVLVYLLPLVLFFVGYGVGAGMKLGGGLSALIGGVLFIGGILAAMWYSHKLKLRNEAPFAITERL
ncbi:Positive regulator of sigma E activity [uncultured Butyricicoccus sp.]|nr:Positive regulator of sigma E activity [uncultured Butyricicoccus sp.]